MEHDHTNGVPGETGERGLYEGPQVVDPVDEDPHADDPSYHTRTKFLTMVAVAMGGVMSAAILVPVVGFAVADPLKEEEWRWVDIGPLKDFPKDKTTSVSMIGPDPEAQRRIYVRNRDESLTILWNRCVHLGCPIAYQEAADIFVCPCHGGAYDGKGFVTGGPPPRPLDRFDVKIVNAQGTEVDYKKARPSDRVLVGKAYSIDENENPYKLHPPGDPVTGILSHLFPFV